MNVLMPHPEWFMPHNLVHLNAVNLLWGKARDTLDQLGHLGKPIRLVGFTSLDRGAEFSHELPSNNLCLHIAGHSHVKGTFALAAVWKRHPEWPTLTIVGDLANGGEECSRIDFSSNNIRHIRNRIQENELTQLRRVHAFHLQPSESEGFGHVVNEASSCGRVLITTDAPPMNELIPPGCGLLVQPLDSSPLNFGRRYQLAPDHLEQTIAKAFALSLEERRALGCRLRAEYLARHKLFMQNLDLALRELFTVASTDGGLRV
ncbi:glycosyltransferase [Gemmatimonas sp. UBA7669]|uniref:glycosyltransferase n=1 Tax=Gemmatimonas sp. UBA7669 TaxID=1946568 RepID=UPI0039C8B9EF